MQRTWTIDQTKQPSLKIKPSHTPNINLFHSPVSALGCSSLWSSRRFGVFTRKDLGILLLENTGKTVWCSEDETTKVRSWLVSELKAWTLIKFQLVNDSALEARAEEIEWSEPLKTVIGAKWIYSPTALASVHWIMWYGLRPITAISWHPLITSLFALHANNSTRSQQTQYTMAVFWGSFILVLSFNLAVQLSTCYAS